MAVKFARNRAITTMIMKALFAGFLMLTSVLVVGSDQRNPSVISTQQESNLFRVFPPLTFSRAYVKSIPGVNSIPLGNESEYPAIKGYALNNIRGEVRFVFERNLLTRFEFWMETEN